MAEKNQVLEMPALGRPFSLGTLYDCRSEKIVPGVTLWDPDTLKENVESETMSSTSYKLQVDESSSDKTSALGIDGSLELSIIGGLVKVSGSAKYLNSKKKSSRSEQVSLHLNSMSKSESLTMVQLGKGKVQHPEVFNTDIATHVVTGIEYGSRTIFLFEREVSEKEQKKDVSGTLKGLVKKIPAISLKGELHVKLNETQQDECVQITCSLYSEGVKNPGTAVNIVEAFKIYEELPNHIDPVPITVYLYPLGLLNSKMQTVIRQISSGLVEEAVEAIDSLDDVLLEANDLLSHVVVTKISARIEKHLLLFKSLVNRVSLRMKSQFLVVLPKIRAGEKEEIDLSNVMEDWRRSPCNTENLKMCLKNIGEEVRILNSIFEQVKGKAEFLEQEEDLVPFLLKNTLVTLVCFVLRIPDSAANYLAEIQTYLGKDSLAGESDQRHWYDDTVTIQAIRNKLQAFSTRSGSKHILFEQILTPDDLKKGHKPGANIRFYHDGKLVNKDFNPVDGNNEKQPPPKEQPGVQPGQSA